MSIASIASCENHPAREAIGVCVQCRTRVCSECSTKVDGINYCVRCLSGLAAQGGRNPGVRRAPTRAAAWVSACAYFGLLFAGTWLLLQVMLPGG
ncbi:MAG TPA: B-box zinc finger protein [Polyangiales bacterium]|nr:B-box zinc finger protein [Polyangiales bacterium]